MLAQNLIVILALALSLTVSATPLTARQTASGNDGDGNQVVGNGGQNAGSITANNAIGSDSIVLQAVWVCGNAQLNCCNRVEDKGDTTNAEMIGAFIGSGDINIQCTPINIAAIASMRIKQSL